MSTIYRTKWPRMAFLMLALFTLLMWTMPGIIQAHSELVESLPQADSRLKASPTQVVLTFNEAIEAEFIELDVLNSKGAEVNNEKAQVSDNHKQLLLDLPQLKEGIYTVTYKIISADGHPVSGAYVFTVGNPSETSKSPLFPIEGHELHEGNHSGHIEHQVTWSMSFAQYIQFTVRILYYLGLLVLAGWVFWNGVFWNHNESLKASMKEWLIQAQRFQLIILMLYIFVHAWNLVGDTGSEQWIKLFTKTDVGMSWTISFVWSLLGFVVLARNRYIDFIWAAGLLGAKALSGHAVGFDPVVYTSGLNFIHLLASAVWVGGITYLALQWRELGESKQAALSMVSKGALYSIIALIITGIASTLAFLPKLSYVLYTQWGEFLIIKTVLVLTVLVVGAYLRSRIKKNKSLSDLLKLDIILMVCIVGVVGIFTFISPVPANEPLYWHDMGTKIHMTTKITPNAPGKNQFIVKIWLPEKSAAPKSTVLRMHPLDSEETGPITVPIVPSVDEEFDSFTGFKKYTYQVEGPYLPFPGRWLVEVRVIDPEDNEKVYKQEMRVY